MYSALWHMVDIFIKEVQRFRVTCLLTGQYNTKEYGTIEGVILCNMCAMMTDI